MSREIHLQALLRQVNILDRQQPRAEARHGAVVHNRGARGRQHVRQMSQRARRQQHHVRLPLGVQQVHQRRHERVQRKSGQALLRGDSQQVTQRHQRLQLPRLLALRPKPRQQGLQAALIHAHAWQQIVQPGA